MRKKQPSLFSHNHVSESQAMTQAQGMMVGVNSIEYTRAIEKYRMMPTDETKAMYTDTLLRVLNNRMQSTWPIIYEALRLSKEYLYKDKDQEFEDYIKTVLGLNLSTWKELEETYRYAVIAKPDLFNKRYDEANSIRKATMDRAEQPKELNEHGGSRKQKQDSNQNLARVKSGENADYLTARIARDRPDILEKMKAGDYKSVRCAAIDAGIIDPEKSQRYQLPTDPESAGKYLAKRVDPEWIETLIESYKENRNET